MMPNPKFQAKEARRIREIARQYEQKGYDVFLQPSRSQRPSFLRDFEPDLIATKPDDRVIVEVISSASRRSRSSEIREFAEQAARKSGWRFELVNIGGVPDQEPDDTWSPSEILSQVRSAVRMAHDGESVASILLAWAALEASVRLAHAETIGGARHVTPTLMSKVLYAEGVLDESEYRAVRHLAELRNRAAHGYKPRGGHRIYIRRIASIVQRMLEYYEKQQGGFYDADNEALVDAVRVVLEENDTPLYLRMRSVSRKRFDPESAAQVPLQLGMTADVFAVEVVVTTKSLGIPVDQPVKDDELEDLMVDLWNDWMHST